jgi:hypothetical protein
VRIALVAALALAGCGAGGVRAAEPAPPPEGLDHCVGRTFDAPTADGFEHTSSKLAAAAGSARHYVQDVIVPPGTAPRVEAKLTYGQVSKDLEDELVQVFVDDCSTWLDAGTTRTDDDGRAEFDLPANLTVGLHEVRVVVLGDGTQATATLWVLPVGTRLVITDVDGTLTSGDSELFEQMLHGTYVPEAYPGASALTRAHTERGHVVVYLTGRPYWLVNVTRGWLRDLGFATGPLHVADRHADILPTEEGVGAYKRAWLQGLLQAGYVVDVAYGNATTDIFAYLGAGLPATSVWIIGKHAGAQGTHAVDASWEARAAEVSASERVLQHF